MVKKVRPRITVMVAPDMLEEIDAYIQQHEVTRRSRTADEALRCWRAQILHEALVEQHAAPKSAEELEERATWKGIREAQGSRLGRKWDRRCET